VIKIKQLGQNLRENINNIFSFLFFFICGGIKMDEIEIKNKNVIINTIDFKQEYVHISGENMDLLLNTVEDILKKIETVLDKVNNPDIYEEKEKIRKEILK